jgi:benzylsuccinate CoA-transferase BbsF subunit
LTKRASPYLGLKVLDFTWAAAGPVVTTYLAFLGADVVKVEHAARPDLMRVSDKQYGYGNDRGINDSPLFNELAADKRSIELDLNNSRDLGVAMELALSADIVVENMRPGKIEKFGLSYDRLAESNPGLIMCSVSATGRSAVAGPPGYAPIFWAEGGGAWMTGWPDANPGLVRGPVDLHAAAFACLGVLALLRRRAKTGKGGYLDCSAIEAVASTVGVHMLEAQCDLPEPVRGGNACSGVLVNDVFPCAGDDQWIALTLNNEAEAASAATVLRSAFQVKITVEDICGAEGWNALSAVTRQFDGTLLTERLSAAGLACTSSMSMLRALEDLGLFERKALQTVDHDTIGKQVVIGLPWMVDGQPYEIHGCAPKLGADRDAVIKQWLGRGT